MSNKEIKQPASALSSPRFCNMGNFMRMQKVEDVDGLDFVVVGIPFDTASSFRVGSRFGPNGIRNISVMMKPNNAILEVNILEELKGGDYGDIEVIPGYILPTYENIENELTPIVQAGVVPIALGGDHSITLAELRCCKEHGKVSLVHFDSHADINEEVLSEKYNHGTPFRRAIEEGLIDHIHLSRLAWEVHYDLMNLKSRWAWIKVIPAHKVRN